MAFGNDQGGQGGGFQKQKEEHKGNWTCGTCGAKIETLPFKPKEERLKELKCKACWLKSRPPRGDRF